MPLTPKQLATGIAWFTLLAQIDQRLRNEEAAARSQGKEPARQGESRSQKRHDFTS
jgi:hypothetical protein